MTNNINPRPIINAVMLSVLLWMVIVLLAGCNPIKQIINNPKHYEAAKELIISNGECVNDTTYLSDTTIVFDTLHAVDYQTDTVRIGDSVWIDRVEYREKVVTKKVTIRDTAIVTDNSRIELLQKKLAEKEVELSGISGQLSQVKADLKAMKKERNKWRLYFWLLVAAITAFILRKPILRIISPIKF